MTAVVDGAVQVLVEGGCAVLELDRPHRHNALNRGMIQTLTEACEQLQDRDDVRVVVLRGCGPSFCVGGDIREFRDLADQSQEERRATLSAQVRILDALGALRQVTVVVVQGLAAGFGVSLVARCDVVLAGRSAEFALLELVIGVVPAFVLLDVQRSMPDKQARDWLLTGERRTAEQARDAGLVSRVVDDADLDDAAAALVTALTGAAPRALRRTVELYEELRGNAETAELRALDEAVQGLVTPEAREGIAAFLERRPPVWPA